MSAAVFPFGMGLTIVWVTVVGFLITRFFMGGVSKAERVAWAFACGLLVHAALYGVFLGLGTRPRPTNILAAEIALVLITLVIWRRGSSRPLAIAVHSGHPSVLQRLWLGGAVAGILLFLLTALAEPMWTTDFLAIWGLKGKTIFLAAEVPHRLFHDPHLFWSHPEYPLLLPLLFASLSAVVGEWNDRTLALLYPACQVATVFAAYGFLKRRVSRLAGSVAAGLIALFFPLYSPFNVGMAEIPLAFGLVLLSCAFLDAQRAESLELRLRLAIAALFSAAIKREGTLFGLLLLFALLLFQLSRRDRGRVLLMCLALPILMHGGFLMFLRGRISSRDFDWTLLAPARWTELPDRAWELTLRLISVEIPDALLALFAVALFFVVTRASFADQLLYPLAAQVTLYAGACVFSAFGVAWLVETSFSRVTMALFPAFAMVLCARLEGAAEASDAEP